MIRMLMEKAMQHEKAYGTFIFEFFDAGIPMMVKQAGGEFIVFDMEHSGVTLERLKPLILLCRALGVVPIVRVPDSQYHHIAGALDIGAQGIIIPMMETAEQMKSVIQSSKYHPLGKRGNAFGIAHDDYTAGNVPSKMKDLNERMMLIPLIETAKGADNVMEIASLDEVDLIWIGHNDLSHSLGIPADFEHPLFKAALNKIFRASAQSGKSCGILVNDAATAENWHKQGVGFFAYSTDVTLFQNALQTGIIGLKNKFSGR